jgi:hypothetical protein
MTGGLRKAVSLLKFMTYFIEDNLLLLLFRGMTIHHFMNKRNLENEFKRSDELSFGVNPSSVGIKPTSF